MIEAADTLPSLDALAAAAGLSRFHFHRLFKRTTGVTPRAYATAVGSQRVRELLPTSSAITTAILGGGFRSNSRFYAQADSLLGMRPKKYRAGGKGATIRFAVGQCSLGAILVAATERGVCAISLGNNPRQLVNELQERFAQAELVAGDKNFEQLVTQVVGLVEAPAVGLDLPLDIRGTAFQQRVWQALSAVKPGEIITYTELARRVGAPKSVRAVAAACAANLLAVAIPCHRVVRKGGALAGYRWGIDRKQALLDRESTAKQRTTEHGTPGVSGDGRG
jgi:AraC family transcriptional regulator of adaptative response/methylated-DNA-[protein]-cysteine methyltransferase